MIRAIYNSIINDLDEKIVLLTGPRQVGKTTLAKSLSTDCTYLNYDVVEHRRIIAEQSWSKDSEFLLFDELHKMPKWKSFLKGLYDQAKHQQVKPEHAQQSKPQQRKTKDNNPPHRQKIIVTGSARLDVAKKMGDSLAGRHFLYTLNPLTLKELGQDYPNSLTRILELGGFPEPFFKNNLTFYRRWQIAHLDIILRQDLIDLELVRNITQIELLVELLRHKVGSPCSYLSLSADLQVSPATVKKWLGVLEDLYVIFSIRPYHKNIARSLLKTPKYYFYDLGRIPGSGGARFENLVALALKSEIDFLRDTAGRKLRLSYLRNKDGQEIDFLISEENMPLLAVEAKSSFIKPERSFRSFFGQGLLQCNEIVQLVAEEITPREYPFGLKIESANTWLRNFNIP